MESIKGNPLRGVSQADLDRALGETQTPSTTEPSGPVGKSTLVQSYPAGYESDVELHSQLDYFSQEEALSDQSDEEFTAKGPYLTDEDEEERYLKTRSTRLPSTYLVDKIARDKATRLEKK